MENGNIQNLRVYSRKKTRKNQRFVVFEPNYTTFVLGGYRLVLYSDAHSRASYLDITPPYERSKHMNVREYINRALIKIEIKYIKNCR